MKKYMILIILLSSIYSRRDCLKEVERDALGRSDRPEKDTLVFSPSKHFYIHYDTTGYAAPDPMDDDGNGIPDYIDKVRVFADAAYYMLVDSMHYEVEPADNDGIYDIYITSLLPGEYGFNWKEDDGVSYLEIGSNYEGYNSPASPEQLLLITISHEYFHAIQRGYKPYYSSNDIYFLEMSSMWFEDVIVPNGNDYLDGWADPLLNNPTVEFDDTGPGYELALFGHYLSSFIDPDGTLDAKNSTIMRQIWENYSSNSTYPLALSSIKNVLNGVEYSSFIECWVDFMTRNLYNGKFNENDTIFYYYRDQALIDQIQTYPQSLIDSISIAFNLSNKSVAIKSYEIGGLTSILDIQHVDDDYVGKTAIVTNNSEGNNFFWSKDTITSQLFTNDVVHLIYASESTSNDLFINITKYNVPIPPSNLTAISYQDSIILHWEPSEGPGDSLYYNIYRNGDSLDILLDINFVDSKGIVGFTNYNYKVTCVNEIGESSPSNSVTIQSWPSKDNVVENEILSIYPNPIYNNNDSYILYALNSDYSNVALELINIKGQTIKSTPLESYQQGWHRANINNLVLPDIVAGVYIIRLQADNGFGCTQKITILP